MFHEGSQPDGAVRRIGLRLGASLGLMLAAPMLNPAVLAVTFLLFPAAMAWSRIGASALLVVFGAALLGRMFRSDAAAVACPIESSSRSWQGLMRDFGSSLGVVAWQSLPAIVIGVVVSAVFAGVLPIDTLPAAGMSSFIVIALVAAVAVPLALPTFGEIPLALALLATGAPGGCAMALLIAGPAINLPSLLMLARTTSWRVAVSTAAIVFGIAFASGMIVEALAYRS